MIYFAVVVVFVYIVWNLHLTWRDKDSKTECRIFEWALPSGGETKN